MRSHSAAELCEPIAELVQATEHHVVTSMLTTVLIKMVTNAAIDDLQEQYIPPNWNPQGHAADNRDAYRLRFFDLSIVMVAAAIGAAGNSAGWATGVTSSFLIGTPMWRPYRPFRPLPSSSLMH